MRYILVQYAITIGWALVGSLSMAIGIGIALKIFTRMTGELKEWEELAKGNIAVAIVLAAVIISVSVVVGIAIMPQSL